MIKALSWHIISTCFCTDWFHFCIFFLSREEHRLDKTLTSSRQQCGNNSVAMPNIKKSGHNKIWLHLIYWFRISMATEHWRLGIHIPNWPICRVAINLYSFEETRKKVTSNSNNIKFNKFNAHTHIIAISIVWSIAALIFAIFNGFIEWFIFPSHSHIICN